MKNRLLLTLSVLLCSIPLHRECQGDIYKYIDDNGVIHLTNMPNDQKYRMIMKTTPDRTSRSREHKFDHLITKLCRKHGVEIPLVKAVIKAESDFNPMAISKKGAQGLMQLMPQKAKELRVDDPFNPRENLSGGIRHLKSLLTKFQGDIPLVLAAYNAGETAVRKQNGIPPYRETRTYIDKVLKYKNYFKNIP
ncbi:MAG: lytic transglycosylase domain-containing protein [Deltaproteobacteria bacterium]|nr:lytic transglycosylase domain-containing protein [Deltaproteobacteria bacterium]